MATGGIDTASEYRACGTFPLAVPHLRYQFRQAFEKWQEWQVLARLCRAQHPPGTEAIWG